MGRPGQRRPAAPAEPPGDAGAAGRRASAGGRYSKPSASCALGSLRGGAADPCLSASEFGAAAPAGLDLKVPPPSGHSGLQASNHPMPSKPGTVRLRVRKWT